MVLTVFLILIKSFLWLAGAAIGIGAVRLFFIGVFDRYDKSLTDVSKLRRGDIVLTGKQSTRYSPLIQISNVLTRKIKHRFWTHAAIYRGDGKLWEALPKGIVEGDINDYLNKGYIVRALRHRYITDPAIINRVVDYCGRQKGRPYGFVGLGFFILSSFTPVSFNFLFQNWFVDKLCKMDNAYFCSELIVEAFADTGYPVSPYDGWRVKPTDFISNPLLEDVS